MIYKGNRTEWSPVRSVIIQVINKIRFLVMIIQTELDDTKSCYQLIITVTISEKINVLCFVKEHLNTKCPKLGKISETLSGVTNSSRSILETAQFGRVSSCCYGYRDNFCDWWI